MESSGQKALRASDGVLLLAHGTVEELKDIPAFLGRIRGGRPASPGLIQETCRRYELIGGSPLLKTTKEQAACLADRLACPVLVGMRLWDPSIDAALEEAVRLGLTRLCLLPLAPYSVHIYVRAAEQAREARIAAGQPAPSLIPVSAWGEHPALIDAHAAVIAPLLGPDSDLILSAHSLPLVALRAGDPYERQVRASAAAIAARLGVAYQLAFQSQGADGGEWLGPSLREAFERARERKRTGVTVAPFGFLSDHVETLYDLDHEARGFARELGLEFSRAPALGTASGLLDALEDLARRALD